MKLKEWLQKRLNTPTATYQFTVSIKPLDNEAGTFSRQYTLAARLTENEAHALVNQILSKPK